MYYITNNELYHHGVIGMKWGIRRYQPYPKGHKGGKEIGEAARKNSSKGKNIAKSAAKFGGLVLGNQALTAATYALTGGNFLAVKAVQAAFYLTIGAASYKKAAGQKAIDKTLSKIQNEPVKEIKRTVTQEDIDELERMDDMENDFWNDEMLKDMNKEKKYYEEHPPKTKEDQEIRDYELAAIEATEKSIAEEKKKLKEKYKNK